jgi:hypothetical protein
MPSLTLGLIVRYLIDSGTYQRRDRQENGVFEVFTKETMLRYKTLRSYDLWKSRHIHMFEFNPLQTTSNLCLVRARSNASFTSNKVYQTTVALDTRTSEPVGAYCYCTAGYVYMFYYNFIINLFQLCL